MMTSSLPKERLYSYFSGRGDVLLAYLFGSVARGQAGPLSDIDVAVLLDGDPDESQMFDVRLEIIGAVMEIFGDNDIAVVGLNQATLSLRYRVLRDGLLLFVKNHQARIDFQSQTVMEYLDFKPFRERHEQAILARARKGALLHGYNPYRGSLERYRQLRERTQRNAESDA